MGALAEVSRENSSQWVFELVESKAKAVGHKKQQILIVEDDVFSQRYFSKVLSERFKEYQPLLASSYHDAVDCVAHFSDIRLIILDVFLEGHRTGIDFFRYLKLIHKDVPIIVTSAMDQSRYLSLLGRQYDVPPYLHKPFQIEDCALLIEKLLEVENHE